MQLRSTHAQPPTNTKAMTAATRSRSIHQNRRRNLGALTNALPPKFPNVLPHFFLCYTVIDDDICPRTFLCERHLSGDACPRLALIH